MRIALLLVAVDGDNSCDLHVLADASPVGRSDIRFAVDLARLKLFRADLSPEAICLVEGDEAVDLIECACSNENSARYTLMSSFLAALNDWVDASV